MPYRRRAAGGYRRRKSSHPVPRSMMGPIKSLRYLAPDESYAMFTTVGDFTLTTAAGTGYTFFGINVNSLLNPLNTASPATWTPDLNFYCCNLYTNYRVNAAEVEFVFTPAPSTNSLYTFNQTYNFMTIPDNQVKTIYLTDDKWALQQGAEFVRGFDISNHDFRVKRYLKLKDEGYSGQPAAYASDSGTTANFSTVSAPWAFAPFNAIQLVCVVGNNWNDNLTMVNCQCTVTLKQYCTLFGRRSSIANPNNTPTFTLEQAIQASIAPPAPRSGLRDDPEWWRELIQEECPTPPSDVVDPVTGCVPSLDKLVAWQKDSGLMDYWAAVRVATAHTVAEAANRDQRAFVRGYVPAMGPMSEVSDSIDVDRD